MGLNEGKQFVNVKGVGNAITRHKVLGEDFHSNSIRNANNRNP
jgi:hypothetical protein